MKAHEAIAILEALDPNYEVTLTLGNTYPKTLPNIPKWSGTPVYPPNHRDYWIKTDKFSPPFEITCGPINTEYKQ